MREIKFRAWAKFDVTPRMESWDEVRKHPLSFVENDHYALMQYTGLKDKNGVEIYESDIVEAQLYKTTKRFAIEWRSINEHSAFGAGTHNLRVIGNIYENPELLKSPA